jgi:N-acetylneuraminic acid mutarotase
MIPQWTFVGGSTLANAAGTYGTLGVAAAGNWPGARSWFVCTMDSSGVLWAFGGSGVDATGTAGELNDLWRYDPGVGLWTWMGGASVVNQPGTYGRLGVADATNWPGARGSAAFWADASGFIWVFGGAGYATTSTFDRLNDLWRYEIATGLWTWMAGANTLNQLGSYGTQGVASSGSTPGARQRGDVWFVPSGNVWIFGGDFAYGSSGTATALADVWVWGSP